MKAAWHVIRFEWKILWRSNTLKALLVVVLGAGIYGIFFGKFEIDKQEYRMETVQQYERNQFDSLLHWTTLDTSLADNKKKFQHALSPVGVGWNKHFTYYLTNDAPPASGLCLGQRDLFPVYYGFNVTDLARQVNTGELANPMKLLTGNFDLSYVFVFILPLLVVALFYNLYAGEKEQGTLPILQTQPIPLVVIIMHKAILRLLIIWGIAFLLLVFGFVIQGISIADNFSVFMDWVLVTFLYVFGWSTIMCGLVWLKYSTSLTAMLGLSIWLILTLVTPALLNLLLTTQTPLPNRAEMIHMVRSQNDRFWESPKTYVLDQFYEDYPQYNDGDTINFDKWYYASFTLLDKEANILKAKYEQQVSKRNDLLAKWEWIAPAAMVHEYISSVSKTDRNSHLEFLRKMHNYHKDLKDLYYTRIFDEDQFSMDDLRQIEEML